MSPQRREDPAKIAIRDGIASYLPELGFRQRAAKLWMRENVRVREYVEFETRGSGLFADSYSLFDKDLDGLAQNAYGDEWRSASEYSGRRAFHVSHGALRRWREAEEAEVEAVRLARPWWSIRRYILDNRESRPSYAHRFIGGAAIPAYWTARDDPKGCAAFTLSVWRKQIEPWRDRVLSDRSTLAAIYLGRPHRENVFKRLLCHVYLGEIDAAEMICREALEREGLAPGSKEFHDARHLLQGPGWTAEMFVESTIRKSIANANLVRRAITGLGLKPYR